MFVSFLKMVCLFHLVNFLISPSLRGNLRSKRIFGFLGTLAFGGRLFFGVTLALRGTFGFSVSLFFGGRLVRGRFLDFWEPLVCRINLTFEYISLNARCTKEKHQFMYV